MCSYTCIDTFMAVIVRGSFDNLHICNSTINFYRYPTLNRIVSIDKQLIYMITVFSVILQSNFHPL